MELTKQEKNLIKEVLERTKINDFCDKTTKMVALSILNKIKEDV